MRNRTWKFTADKKEHTAIFNPGGWRAMPTLLVDDKPVELTAVPKVGRFPMFSDFNGTYHNHQMLVRISTNGFTNFYDMAVDGISRKTGKPLGPGPVIPTWSWLFFFACIAVAFMDINNFIFSIVAMVAGFGCIAIASEPVRDIKIKLAACIELTVVSWAVYFFMMK